MRTSVTGLVVLLLLHLRGRPAGQGLGRPEHLFTDALAVLHPAA